MSQPFDLESADAASPAGAIAYLQADYPGTPGRQELVPSEVSGALVQGAMMAACEAGFELIVKRAPCADMRRIFDELRRRQRLAGVIYATFGGDSLLRHVTALGLPAVLLGHDANLPRIHTVRDDSFEGARQAVHHLAELGHRLMSFACRTHPDLKPWQQLGFRQGLRDLHLARRGRFELGIELTPASIELAADRLLALSPRPTAVFCSDNSLASELSNALALRGVSVPDELYLFGGGGEEIHGLPGLHIDWHDMGWLAIDLLQRASNEATLPTQHLLVPALLDEAMAAG
ncbi:MAG: substrate-binding domain-containing protein [Gemmataceae bacterium]